MFTHSSKHFPRGVSRAGRSGFDVTGYWPNFTRKDIGGILLALILIGGLVFTKIAFPDLMQRTNWGFGTAWDCISPGEGGPVCVKK